MRCSKCGSDNREGRKFCANCAAPLAITCATCGATNEAGEKYCGECAAALGDAPLPRVKEAVPARASAGGERRHLTVLFCDLVGSTEIAAQLDPEEWRELVARYHRAAAEAIARYEGHVAKYLGDGVMAYFGWPEAHDNDAERAVRAGLAILDAISKLEQASRLDLVARIGIDSGGVVVGTGASKDAEIFGDAPNIAARVQVAAEPGTVLITTATHRLVSGLFVVEERGTQALRGISQRVALYRVIRPSGMRGRLAATAAVRGMTSFINREEELRLLLNRWELVREGDGQVVTIVGEAGIGKSRLMQQFHEQIAANRHTWLECSTAAFFQNTPFHPIIEMLQQTFHFHINQNAEHRLAALEASLGTAGLNLEEAMPLIASLLELPLGGKYPPSSLPPDQQRKRLLAVLAAWMIGFARTQPVVMATEDIHWADPSTLELSQIVVEQGATAPLLVLYTARPEFRAQWPLRAHHTQITLNRLSARHVRTMIGQVAAQKALSEETVNTVVERTSGVPLFVEELTRTVLEIDAANISGREIPVTLHDSLMARLDRLGSAKELLQIGTVIGNEFSYELLRAVVSMPEDRLQNFLRKLIEADLLYVRGIAPDAIYMFKHALIRDAGYEALLKSRRKELHLIVARVVNEKFPVIKETHPEVLAHHWTEAGENEPAIPAWQKAAEQAVERRAYREAERHYANALTALQSLPESPKRDKHELTLLLAISPVLIAIKGWASLQVEQSYMRAKELAERSAEPAAVFPILMGLWVTGLVRSHFRAAFEIGEQLLVLAHKVNDSSLLLQAHQALGDTSYQLGEFELARTHLEATLSLCGRERLKSLGVDMEVVARSYLSRTLWFLGYPQRALEMSREAVTLAQKLNDPFSLVFAENFLAGLHELRRELADYRNEAERVIKLCTEHGFPYWWAHTTIRLGEAIAQQGQGDEAFALINRGIAAAAATGAEVDRVDFLRPLAEAYSAMNRFDDALDTLARTLEIGRQHQDLYLEAEIYRIKGELLLRQDFCTAEAHVCFQRGIEVARHQSAKSLELRATTSLARLLKKQGRRDEAHTMLADIYNWFTEGFDTADLKEAKALLDELSD